MENKINKNLFVINVKDVKKIKEILEREKIDYSLFSNVEDKENKEHFTLNNNENETDDWGNLAEFDNVIEDDSENEGWD